MPAEAPVCVAVHHFSNEGKGSTRAPSRLPQDATASDRPLTCQGEWQEGRSGLWHALCSETAEGLEHMEPQRYHLPGADSLCCTKHAKHPYQASQDTSC